MSYMEIAFLRKPVIIVSSILILSLFCHSCFPVIPTTVSYRGPIDDEALSFLQIGITTKEDVLLKLGNPTSCSRNDSLFGYRWKILYGIWFFAAGGGGVGGPIARKHSVSLEFDEHGILKKYEVKSSTDLGPMGDHPEWNCR